MVHWRGDGNNGRKKKELLGGNYTRKMVGDMVAKINPLNSAAFEKLTNSIEWSDRVLVFPKAKRVDNVRQFIGFHNASLPILSDPCSVCSESDSRCSSKHP